jgi:hypothetical protein
LAPWFAEGTAIDVYFLPQATFQAIATFLSLITAAQAAEVVNFADVTRVFELGVFVLN